MNRLVYLLGAVVFLAASLALTNVGDAIIRLCDVLTYDVTAARKPLPESLHQTLYVALSAALLSVGLCLVCFGIMLPCKKHAITTLGRFLHVAAAVAIFASATWSVWGTFSTQQAFFDVALSDTSSNPDEVDTMLQANSHRVRIGFTILAGAAGLSLAVVLVGFRRISDRDLNTAHIASWLATFGAVLACAIFFSVTMFFIRAHAATLESLQADEAGVPKAHELADHLSGAINNSMVGFLLLACIAAAQMLAAFLAPAPLPSTTSIRQA